MKINEMSAAVTAERFKANCLDCGEVIVHSVCPTCISKWFVQWLEKYPKLRKEVSREAKKFLRVCKNNNYHSHGKCVVCGRKANVCPKCFTEHLYNLVKRAGASFEELGEFLFIFNFDFEHDRYIYDLEAYENLME